MAVSAIKKCTSSPWLLLVHSSVSFTILLEGLFLNSFFFIFWFCFWVFGCFWFSVHFFRFFLYLRFFSFSFFLFVFCLRFFSFSSFLFFQGCLHSGRSKVTRVVGRDTIQSFRVCKVTLATQKIATKENRNGDKSPCGVINVRLQISFFSGTVTDVKSRCSAPNNSQRIDANTDALPFQLRLCSWQFMINCWSHVDNEPSPSLFFGRWSQMLLTQRDFYAELRMWTWWEIQTSADKRSK